MAISKEDILEYISGLSVLELSELVKEFEEKFGVTAQPVAVAMEESSDCDIKVSINNISSKPENINQAIAVLIGMQINTIANDINMLDGRNSP